MNRRNFVVNLLAIIGAFSAVRRAVAWDLVSKEQAEAVNKVTEKDVPSPQDPKAPSIEIDAPDISKPVKAPVSIRLRFKPQAGATIDPKTFQAKYGWFDITNQILANAKFDASGLTADNAQVPSGRYRVTIRIADTNGHFGVKVIEFTVA